jgi:hypothetical protein
MEACRKESGTQNIELHLRKAISISLFVVARFMRLFGELVLSVWSLLLLMLELCVGKNNTINSL